MSKRIKLYKCSAMVIDEPSFVIFENAKYNTMANIITEYIFAGNKTDAIKMFEDRNKDNMQILHTNISEVNISPGLTIYKNKHNYNIEDKKY